MFFSRGPEGAKILVREFYPMLNQYIFSIRAGYYYRFPSCRQLGYLITRLLIKVKLYSFARGDTNRLFDLFKAFAYSLESAIKMAKN